MNFEKKNMKIFLVAGKARNGKDTTADIIREYYDSKGLKTANNSYAYYMKDYAKRITGWDGTEENKPREFLQQFGTNLVRNHIDNNFFVHRMLEDLTIFEYFYDVVTISDGRLPIELDTIRNERNNVVIIRVNRPDFDNGLTEEQKAHITETGLDDYSNYDYVLTNDGSIDDLKTKIYSILKEVDHES